MALSVEEAHTMYGVWKTPALTSHGPFVGYTMLFLGKKNGPKPVKFLRSSRIFEIRPRSKMAAPHVRWKVRGSEATIDTEKHGICVYISKISINQYGSTHF